MLLLFLFLSYFVPMKNKILLFLLLLFLGGEIVPVHAMPPKPMNGRPTEEKTEEQKEEGAATREEQGRRSTDSGDANLSSVVERGMSLGAREQEEGAEINQNLDLSSEKFDESLAAILQAEQECEEMIRSTHVEALDEGALREKADEVEKQIQYWSRQKSNISILLATRLERRGASDIGEEQKLSSALNLCRALWMKWDDFFSAIQDEIEKRNGSFIDEGEESEVGSLGGLETPMASMKLADSPAGGMVVSGKTATVTSSRGGLKSRLENFLTTPHLAATSLVDSQLSLTQGHQQGVRSKIEKLLQRYTNERTLTDDLLKRLESEGTKLRKKVKKDWEDPAAVNYSQAELQYRQGRIAEAMQSYEKAITFTDKAIQMWHETEVFYTRLRDVVGGTVRRFGIRIKEGLKQNVREWQLKLDGISLERQNNLNCIEQKLNPLQAEREAVLEQARVVEEVEQNEVGTTCRVIAGNLAAMMFHLQAAQNSYNQYHLVQGRESETIAHEIKQEVDRLKPHLETRLRLWNEWREGNFVPHAIEENDQKSVWKMRFMGPLIRKETVAASAAHPEHELEMAAEHLMVVLNPGQSEEGFCNDLAARAYLGCRLEVVSEEDSLYRLCFQRQGNSWLQTMDGLKNSIQENQLAARCYPDHMMELDSGPLAQINAGMAAAVAAPVAPVQEPWAFHHEKGLRPPAGLFDVQYPFLPAPLTPIKVAVIDSGIFGSIATGVFATHDALVGKISHTFDQRQQKATGFGYNAVDPLHPGVPEDLRGGSPKDGHGTHVAGIVAASRGVVADVAGLAGMPGFVELIICKWIQLGSNKGLCSDAIKCIKYAEQQGSQIMNCSWGGRLHGPKNKIGFTPDEVQDLENSIRDKPFVVVAAAGNSQLDTATINQYPCNFVLQNLISVAGINQAGKVPNGFSNFGKNDVDVAAPGKNIISTWINAANASATMTGTSQAAPYVTAALALAKIKFPFLTHIQLANYLRYASNGASGGEMQVKHGPLNLTNVLSEEMLLAFLKAQKMTDPEVQTLLKSKKVKKKK